MTFYEYFLHNSNCLGSQIRFSQTIYHSYICLFIILLLEVFNIILEVFVLFRYFSLSYRGKWHTKGKCFIVIPSYIRCNSLYHCVHYTGTTMKYNSRVWIIPKEPLFIFRSNSIYAFVWTKYEKRENSRKSRCYRCFC